MNVDISADDVAGGLYEFIKQRPFILDAKPAAHAQHEEHAIAIVLDLMRDSRAAWDVAAMESRQTAVALLLDFMAKLMAEGSPLRQRIWRVSGTDLISQAQQAIVAEICRSHPQQSRPL